MQDAKEEVRMRLDIEDVISEYVQLKRAGRNFKGLSPFTSEKTPSFMVSPDKNIWHDFSSNKGGDIFSFIMEVEGLNFRGALELLARKAGVDLSVYSSAASQNTTRKRNKIIEINTLANKYYQYSLANNKHAMGYVFNDRKLSKQIVREFGVGYAPSTKDALVKFLQKRNYRLEDIKMAGLTNRFSGDMFRGRMTVALMDATGQIIGFTARQIGASEDGPKYLNTPQTLAYDKGRHVFGLSQAKESIRKQDFAVLVEGNMDVISSHQVGVKNVVATAGTALTVSHLKTLSRLSRNIKLAFDGDAAGIAATERAIGLAKDLDIDLFIVSMPPDAKDPDELIQKGTALWQKAILSETPALDWVIDQYLAREDLTTAIGKRNFTNASLKLLRLIEDPVVVDYYLNKISQLAGVSKTALKNKTGKNVKPSDKKPQKRVHDSAKIAKLALDETQFEDHILGLMILDKSNISYLSEQAVQALSTEERQEVAKFMLKKPNFTEDELVQGLQNHDTCVKIILLKAEERYSTWSKKDQQDELVELLHQLDERKRKQKKLELTEQLKDAELMGDEAKADEIRVALNKFIKENHGKAY